MKKQSAYFNSALTSDDEKQFLAMLIFQLERQRACSFNVSYCALLARKVLDGDATSLTQLLAFNPYMEHASESDVYYICQIQALFKKREYLTGIEADKRGGAFATFLDGERRCSKTNAVLRDRDDPDYQERATLIFQMSRKISQILGDCPGIDELDCSFGPGANVGCKKNTNVKSKLASQLTTTDAAWSAFSSLAPNYHAWPGIQNPTVVSGSSWTSVPKTFVTDRGINIEPILNAFVQKGIGSYIRDRLRKWGVNLNDQTRNQRMAREGSRDYASGNSYATIDLSNASDTIAYLLVLDLLPFDWFCLLDSFRSPVVAVSNMERGKKELLLDIRLEKFSAMGNAYTFELESLIFYALLLVSCDCDQSDISVYGDDMICPARCFDQVVHNLELLGFVPNKAKSFARGPFRESCGKDYWAGTDVRPVYLKNGDVTYADVFRLHNAFVRNGRLDVTWMLEWIPSRMRVFGPDGYGDGHLIGDCPIVYSKNTHRMYYKFRTFRAKPVSDTSNDSGRYGAFLHANRRSSDSMASESIDQRRNNGQLRYRIAHLRVPVVAYGL